MLKIPATLRAFVLAALCSLIPAAVAATADSEQRLAVVNVSFIFENYKKVPEVQRKIDGQYDPERKALQQRVEELQKRQKEIDEYFNQDQQSVKTFDAVQKLRKDQFVFEREMARVNFEIQKAYTREMREVLTDIRVAIKNVAEKGGFGMVLRSPDTDDPVVVAKDPAKLEDPAASDKRTLLELTSPTTVAGLVERFNRNPVLFGAKTVDITNEVLTKLNDEYNKRMGLQK
jgi:Skp family chaperone for outer membrane proteins